jgi:hypothetical protein
MAYCKSEMMLAQQQEGVSLFCNTGYLIKNIPAVWRLPPSSPPDQACVLPTKPQSDAPQVYLTCYSRAVLKTSLYAKNIQKRLDEQKAQQAVFCT